MNLSTLVCRISLIAVFAASLATAGDRFFTTFELSEHQLDINRGGRVNSIAVHPIDRRRMVVASETGGLFQTFDGGQPWTHVRFADMPAMFTQSVVYLPWDPTIMLATAKADFKETNGGGLWRSLNGGQSWHRIGLAHLIPNFTGRLNAYGISVVDGNRKLVIGTSEGIFWSTDPQAGAWNYSNVFPSGDKTVYSVFVENGNPARMYAGGPSGVRFTNLPTISWQQPAVPPSLPGDPGGAALVDIHAFGKTPVGSPHQQLFVVNQRAQLFRSGDRGVTWTRISTLPGGDGCAGTAFIRVGFRSINTTQTLELYFGNRCMLRRREVRVANEFANYEERPWVDAQHDGNPRDLGMFRSDPELLGSNFGLHKTVIGLQQGLIWNLAGNGRTGGYNALQIAEVDGQRVQKDGVRVTDLYIATQDNNLWSFSQGVVHPPFIGSACFIEGQRDVTSLSDAVFTFAPGPHPPRLAGRHLNSVVDWPLPPSEAGKPAFIGHGGWVQQVRAGTFQPGLAWKPKNAPWRQYAVYSAEPRDIPKLGRPGSIAVPRHPSIVYQAFRNRPSFRGGPRRNLLMRLYRELDTNHNAQVFFPAMEGFGSLGINPTMFAWYQVFGVDPNRAFRLIAPDVHGDASPEAELKRQVKMSTDGGETWSVIPGLKELMSTKEDGTKLLFRTDLSGRGLGEVFPLVTAVSFCPDDSRLVLIGTSEGGIYFSDNHGQLGSWRRIANSDEARYVTSFFWEDANNVFVSTYGRGLWKLTGVRVAIPDIFDEELCLNCEVLATDSSPDQPAFDGSVMAFGGPLLGVRTEDDQLREVFVQPGTSVIFTGDLSDSQDDIVITRTDGSDTSEYTELPEPPHDGWVLTGVVFTKGDMLTGAVYAESEISLVPPVTDEDVKGSTVSPIDGQPYIRVVSSDFSGVATVAPGETFAVTATDFPAGMRYEVLVDGQPLKGDVTADGSGSFTARISAPAEQGGHRVEVRAVGSTEVVDGSEFVVR